MSVECSYRRQISILPIRGNLILGQISGSHSGIWDTSIVRPISGCSGLQCGYTSLICDNSVTIQNFFYFSGETFKVFQVLFSAMRATTTQLLSSGEFCKMRYDTIPVKVHLHKRFFLYQ